MTRVPPALSGRSVVHVADFSPPFATNFVSSLLNLDKAIRAQLGLRSLFVFPEQARRRPWLHQIEDAGVLVRFIEPNSSHRIRIRALKRIGKESDAVLFHSHFGTFDVDVAYAASRAGAAAIWHMHSPYPSFGQVRKRVGERFKFVFVARAFVDCIVAVSPSVAESAVKRGGPRRRTRVVLNGIDLDRVRPVDERSRSALRANRGVEGNAVAFLLFGWDPNRKGVDVLTRAVEIVPRLTPLPFRCFVVGREDDPAVIAQVPGDNPFLQVLQPVDDVRELYGLADCFVLASRAEGLPYAIGEAMASGLPVISSNLPQVVETFGPTGRGLLSFMTGDAEDLAAAMVQILSMTPEERRHLGIQNAAYVRDHLSLDHWVEDILSVYQSVLARRFGPARQSLPAT